MSWRAWRLPEVLFTRHRRLSRACQPHAVRSTPRDCPKPPSVFSSMSRGVMRITSCAARPHPPSLTWSLMPSSVALDAALPPHHDGQDPLTISICL